MNDCIFCKIVNKEIASDILYEDDTVVAFNDINPQAPVHILIVPKKHYDTLNDIDDSSLYEKIYHAVDVLTAEKKIKESGYRVTVNCNQEGGQVVFHVHFHLLGGRQLTGQLG